jgi:redox-sensitive bicupin YhaK (pirin superfamily)
MWVVPDTASIDPGYQQVDVNDLLDNGGLVPVASGQGHDSAIAIQQRDAVLWAARLKPGERITVPEAGFGHVFVARGSVEMEAAGPLFTGDAARLTATDGMSVVADPNGDGAEILIWTTGPLP